MMFLFIISLAFNVVDISEAIEVVLNPYASLPREFNSPQVYDYTKKESQDYCECYCENHDQENEGYFYDFEPQRDDF